MHNCNGLNETQQPEISSRGNQNSLTDEVLSAARAEELRQAHIAAGLPPGFYFDDENWLTYKQDMSKEGILPVKICSRLEVIARSRNPLGENHGRILQFFDPDGMLHRWTMPMELLASDGAIYRQELLSKGLLIAPGSRARQLLTIYIQESNPSATVICVEQTGWSRDRSAFILHSETIGNLGDEPLILQTSKSSQTAQAVSGSLSDWQQISKLSQGNSLLILSLSCGFAPPLLDLLELENGGLHVRGGSSLGKSICLKAAASVWGPSNYVCQNGVRLQMA